MYKRSTNVQKEARIKKVMDLLVQDVPEEVILQFLMKPGMSSKQAGRYLKMGQEALEMLALQQDPFQYGKFIHRADKLAMALYQGVLKEGDPDGKKTRASIMANKSAVDIAKTVVILNKEMKGQASSNAAEQTQEPDLFQLFDLD